MDHAEEARRWLAGALGAMTPPEGAPRVMNRADGAMACALLGIGHALLEVAAAVRGQTASQARNGEAATAAGKESG